MVKFSSMFEDGSPTTRLQTRKDVHLWKEVNYSMDITMEDETVRCK